MAGLRELNSFLGKFVSLWQEGHTASLQLSTTGGEAHLNLQVGLGRAPQLQHQGTNPPYQDFNPGPICLSCWERQQQESRPHRAQNSSEESSQESNQSNSNQQAAVKTTEPNVSDNGNDSKDSKHQPSNCTS